MNRMSVAVGLWVLGAGIVLVGWGPAQGQDAAAPADAVAPADPAKPADSGPDWASLSPGDLAGLAREMAGDDAQLKAARQAIADFVAKTYLKDAVAVKTVAVGDWRALVESLGSDLSLGDRAAWLDKIVGAYAGSAEAVRGLKADELRNVGGAVKVLGATWQTQNALVARIREAFDANAAGAMKYDDVRGVCDTLGDLGARPSNDLVKAYVDKSQEWQSFDAGKLADVAGRLDGLGPSAGKQQTALAKCLMATYLGGVETVKSLDLDTWGSFARMGRYLGSKDRKAWVDALKAAFAPDEGAMLQLAARDMGRLARCVEPLDEPQSKAMAYAWFTKSDLAKTATEEELTAVLWQAASYKDASLKDAAAVPKAMEAFYAAKVTGPMTFGQCLTMMNCWIWVEDMPKVQEWTLKAYQCALGTEEGRQSVTVEQLEILGEWLSIHAQLTGPDKSYPAMATALARHARVGTLKSSKPEMLGGVLGTPETRQTLRAELVDAQGDPRIDTGRVLARAYCGTPELGEWRQFVEKKGADTGASADTRAGWLLIRGYIDSVRPFPESPFSLRGKDWLEQVIQLPASLPLRLEALAELVRGYAAILQYDTATKLMDQFEAGSQGAGAVALLRRELDETRFQQEAAAKAYEARAKASYWAHVEARLDQARAKGDGEAVALYEGLLKNKD